MGLHNEYHDQVHDLVYHVIPPRSSALYWTESINSLEYAKGQVFEPKSITVWTPPASTLILDKDLLRSSQSSILCGVDRVEFWYLPSKEYKIVQGIATTNELSYDPTFIDYELRNIPDTLFRLGVGGANNTNEPGKIDIKDEKSTVGEVETTDTVSDVVE